MTGSGIASRRRWSVAIALTVAAGFVDAFGYIALHQIFTAQMSGNTVLVAVHSLAGDPAQGLRHAYTIAMFLMGLMLSGVTIELVSRAGLRHVLAPAMLVEAACLAAVAMLMGVSGSARFVADDGPLGLVVALTAIAMGIQNTSLRTSGLLTVYTTHVTGTITKLSEDAIRYAFSRMRRGSARSAANRGRSQDAPPIGVVLFSLALFIGFLGGAMLAAFLVPEWRPGWPLAVPIGLVLLVGAADALSPLLRSRD